MIYLDNAATTKISDSALNTYNKVADRYFANSFSLHDPGSEASAILEASRKKIAELLNGDPNGLFFTGSGSEATFLAITSLAFANDNRGKHLVTTNIEHSSVTNTFLWLESRGFEVSRIGTNRDGRIDPENLKRVIRPDTILASVQHVNSETGTIQNVKEIGEILYENNVLFHSDCVQSFGKIPVSTNLFKTDAITVSAHKIHGPKGTGAAWISPSAEWQPFLPSVTHEKGFRPGTVDVPSVAAFAAAASDAEKSVEQQFEKYVNQRKLFIDKLLSDADGLIEILDPGNHSIPNIIGIRTCQMEGQYAMLECSQKNLAISTGSACQVNEQKPSPMMLNLGYTEELARQLIRVSLGKFTTNDDLTEAARILSSVVKKQSKVVSN